MSVRLWTMFEKTFEMFAEERKGRERRHSCSRIFLPIFCLIESFQIASFVARGFLGFPRLTINLPMRKFSIFF